MSKNYLPATIFAIIVAIPFFAYNKFNLSEHEEYHSEYDTKSLEFLPPEASISGSTTVCKNATEPEITFSGSGGTVPYTFTYTINNGANQTISTTGNNSSVLVKANTNNTGVFTYRLISVEDDNGDIENTIGNAVITVINPPDGSLGGTGSGSTFEDKPVFRQCSNTTSDFTFTNTSTTSSSINTNYTIIWGDGSPNFNESSWTTTSHTYPVGIYNLIYTIEGTNGCDTTINYTVFVGSNPAVSLGNPGNTDICNTRSLTFPITGTDNNPPGTTYTVTFNDGSAPQTFNHPPPSDITHTFTSSSCNTTSSDGTNSYVNSFSASIVAKNPCSSSSVGVVPIYVSIAPEADFISPEIGCINTDTCFSNRSIGEENLRSGSVCDTSPNIIWEVSPNTGYSVTQGSLGEDFGLADGNSWLSGSDDICFNFTESGTYTVTLKTGNRCGSDTVTKTICIQPELTAAFTLNTTNGCAPFSVQTTNTTDLSSSCGNETYLWEVTYASDFCGTTSDWNFTNGTDENSAEPTMTFTNAGTYTLTLTTTNSCGTSSISETIEVKQPPTNTITAIEDFCGSTSISPTATINNCTPASEVPTYLWSFPGGTPATANTLIPGEIEYSTPGDYTVSFSITTSCGTTTDTEDFSINPIPSITNTNLSQTICSGTDTAEINLTADLPNTLFTWSASAPAGVSGFTVSGKTNTIPVQTIFNSNATAQNVTYAITPSLNGCVGATTNVIITVNPAPEFTSQPQPETICLDGPLTPLSITVDGPGTPSYKWFSNTTSSNTGGTEIIGETASIYTPPSSKVGTVYYYSVASFTSGFGCNEITSNTARIEITEGINIIANPLVTQGICAGGDLSTALSTTYSGGTGTITHQWYSNTSNSNTGGTLISGATASTYTPPTFTTAGTYYYYMTINASGNGCNSINSDTAEIIVVDDPVFDTQPIAFQERCQNATSQDLVVVVSGGLGTVSYQWYSNTLNSSSGGTLLAGATNSTFTPPTTTIGTLYYYCIATQDVSGCSNTSEISETITLAAPAIENQPIGDSLCLDGLTNSLNVTYINGSGTPSYQWYENSNNNTTLGSKISNETSPSFTPPTDNIGTTYYYVILTFSSGGCNEVVSNTAEIEIVPIPEITVQPLPSQSICVGGNPDALAVAPSGGTGVITYQWYSNTINSNTGGTPISGATADSYTPQSFSVAGNYYYYVTMDVDGNGCGSLLSDPSEIIVVDDPVFDSQPISFQELCQNATPLDLEVSISGGLGSVSYQWYSNTSNTNSGGTPIPNATNNTLTPAINVIGTLYYYCTSIQDVSGCSNTSETATVSITAAPVFIEQPSSNTLCLGDATPPLEVSYINGTGVASYAWYQNNINDFNSSTLINGANTPSYSPPVDVVGTTFYFGVIAFSTGGCSEIISSAAEITINQVPEISNYSDVICSGNSFIIIPDDSNGDIVPANTSYTWAAPVINPAGTITGASAESNPQTGISQTLTNTSINTAIVTYTISPTSGDCLGDDFQISIEVNPSISVSSVTTNSTCYTINSGTIDIDITGGVPFSNGNPYLINWTGPNGYTSTNEDVNNLAPGDYTLIIEDAGGCPFTDTFTVTEPEELIFSDIDFNTETISCYNANDGTIGIEVAGGTVPYTYNWTKNGSAFATTQDISNIGAGDYIITIVDANNCAPITQSFSVIEPPELQVSLVNQVDIICFGEATGEINISAIGGRPFETSTGVFDYTFAWTGPNGFSSSQQNLSALLAGTYNLTLTDKSGCTNTLEVILNQTDEIIIDLSTTEIECYGDNNATISINSITGGNAPYSISWSNLGSGMSQNNLSAGTYIITITDDTNCIKEATVIIEEAPIFRINPDINHVSCFGENDGRIVLNLEGGLTPLTLSWDDDPSAGLERNNIGPGTYKVTITDGTPCEISETFTINEPNPLSLTGNTTDALNCEHANSGGINTIVTGGTLPFNYTWSNGETTEHLDNIPPGDYSVTITDANNCTITGNWTINRFDELTINIETVADFNCADRTVNQSFIANITGGVPPYTINWSSGTVSGTNGEIMKTTQDGLIIIDIEDSQGCVTNLSYNVDIPVLGEADFSLNSLGKSTYSFYSVQDPIQFTNAATGDFSTIQWDFGDGNFSNTSDPTHTYVKEGTYNVLQTITYPFGCVYTKQLTIIIEKGYSVIVPNAFTPNGDSMNDYFAPESIALHSMELNIYNTWGSLIYSEKGDDLKGWDGKINNADAENGNYYFTLTAQTFYGQTVTREGAFVSIK